VELILEVIALDAADARAARDGGADRIELVSDMRRQGLTPELATFDAVRAAVDLPVRVMLRDQDGYALEHVAALRTAATALRRAGADQFVLGFLDARGAVDLAATEAVLEAIDGCRWTFHRAIDHATDRAAAWHTLAGLPGLDQVLTAGSPQGVSAGLPTLQAEATHLTTRPGDPDRPPNGPAAPRPPGILAGGGLRREHVAPLLAAGVRAFHSGGAVRAGNRWDAPVDPTLVAEWRAHLQP
jgi:copper homeostasis protein